MLRNILDMYIVICLDIILNITRLLSNLVGIIFSPLIILKLICDKDYNYFKKWIKDICSTP